MSGNGVLHFDNVSKSFLFTHDQPRSVWDSIRVRFMRKAEDEYLWAVRDVSFQVDPGQSVGIIGRNGSGKSTLLKLATRILRPTSGQVFVGGRISALLELGAGFHHDLTGRENVFLNGSVLGLTKQEILDRFDDILAFSGLGNFIDMPVKHYSSGMYMRLGFSVAVHCDPDVLLVDEILAVGDQAFQEKCMDRILLLRDTGVTVLIVSHHLKTMQALCDHLVWMDKGKVLEMGPADEVAQHYLDYMSKRNAQGEVVSDGETYFHRYGTREVVLTAVKLLDQDGEPSDTFQSGAPLIIEMQYQANRPIRDPEFGYAIHRTDNVHVCGSNNRMDGNPIDLIEGEGIVRFRIDELPLLNGVYALTAAVHDGLRSHAYDYHEKAYRFRIISNATHDPTGLVKVEGSWSATTLEIDETTFEPEIEVEQQP
jgi:ABC-type polysaccharide/polyol phosphate transport system ATPase subunit